MRCLQHTFPSFYPLCHWLYRGGWIVRLINCGLVHGGGRRCTARQVSCEPVLQGFTLDLPILADRPCRLTLGGRDHYHRSSNPTGRRHR